MWKFWICVKSVAVVGKTRGRSAQEPPNPWRRLFCSDAISDEDIDRTGKDPKMKELLFKRAFIYCIHGRCREHALALTHRRICKKIAKFPISIAISDGDIYRWKAECTMICHLSKLYMAIIIVAVEWTLWLLHIVDFNRKWTVFKHHFRLRCRRYQKAEKTMPCYSSRAFIT